MDALRNNQLNSKQLVQNNISLSKAKFNIA